MIHPGSAGCAAATGGNHEHFFTCADAAAARAGRAGPPLAHGLAEASHVSGLSASTLRRRAREGRLKLVRVGRRTLVDAQSLRRLLGAELGAE
ncbi:MAG: helix-turn-helix domain-containing protein [Roseococcus sp.]|nr:helix-turn-helix domain-containing protein [Roseococcus sp.]